MITSYTNINRLVRSLIYTQDIKVLAKIANFSKKSITYSGGIRNYKEISIAAELLERFFQDIDPKSDDLIAAFLLQGSWRSMAIELFNILNAPYLREY